MSLRDDAKELFAAAVAPVRPVRSYCTESVRIVSLRKGVLDLKAP